METRPKGKSFEELLIEKGIATKERLRELYTRSVREKKTIERLLLESGAAEDGIAAVKA